MQKSIIGWDIGGAHVKAAILDSSNVITQVWQLPCPLWKGLDYLTQAVDQIQRQFNSADCLHVITMTGELVDLFSDREQGVEQIIGCLQQSLIDQEILVYAGLEGFIALEQLQPQHYPAVASANWLASSCYAASQVSDGLFVDIGSTTTDILILSKHHVEAQGMTDYQRMQSGELVYTGIIRTPVMAVADQASFKGQPLNLMAEHFATMADVYRLTAELNELHDQAETADGAEKTVMASARRLSRMTGYDFKADDLAIWKQFAENIKAKQQEKIRQAVLRQLSRNLIPRQSVFIGAGVGRFLVRQLADELAYTYRDFSDLIVCRDEHSVLDAADCAPAVAVALLASVI